MTTTDEIPDPNSLRIACRVNGETKQDANTGHMIFDCAEIVAFTSTLVTLEPGDIISTGTPAGVGATQGKLLKDGDMLTTSIEGIGTIKNKIVRISDHSNSSFIPEFIKSKMPQDK